MKTRDYQEDARNAIRKAWEEHTSVLVVMPTGTGKTVVFASIIHDILPGRTMVIAHREELIWQARDKITAYGNVDCGVEMGEAWVNTSSLFADPPVVISTVQTQNSQHGDRKRMSRFKPQDFELLIIDEAHHATATSYRNLINYYIQNNPKIKVLGVTATPDRADEEALGQVFDDVAYDYEILDAIRDGWLVPIEQEYVHIDSLDFSKMRTTAGDLNGADLASVMEAENNMQGVAGSTIEIVGSKRTIVFTASVKQAEQLSDIFNRFRPGMSEWVCGTTPKDDRRTILSNFESGKVQVVCNCGVLTEGFDNPGVEIVVMARPTKSRSLYAQMAGRSTRPLPGIVDKFDKPHERRDAIKFSAKPCCLIVDFVGNSGRHKLMSSADILGGKVSDAVIERAALRVKTAGGRYNMAEVIAEEEEDDIKRREEEKQRMEELRLRNAARKERIVADVKFTKRMVSPFDVFDITPVKVRGWDASKVLSEKQRGLLLKQGINPDELPYAQGKQLINEMFRRWNKKLCTLKQANCLKKYGYDTKNMTMKVASDLITALANNGWKKL